MRTIELSRQKKTQVSLKAIGLSLILGVLMSGCTTPPPPGASPTTSTRSAKNPHEAIDGASVSPSRDLKNAVNDAYNLHRELISLADPSFFVKGSSAITNQRSSSETPAYKDGKSYWNLNTSSNLKGGIDANALFEKMRSYLESQGYTMTLDNRDGKRAGPAGTVDFRKDAAVEYVSLSVGSRETFGGIGLSIVTADFANPPVSEWPKPGQNETWRPDAKLWPAGIGAVEPTPPPLVP